MKHIALFAIGIGFFATAALAVIHDLVTAHPFEVAASKGDRLDRLAPCGAGSFLAACADANQPRHVTRPMMLTVLRGQNETILLRAPVGE